MQDSASGRLTTANSTRQARAPTTGSAYVRRPANPEWAIPNAVNRAATVTAGSVVCSVDWTVCKKTSPPWRGPKIQTHATTANTVPVAMVNLIQSDKLWSSQEKYASSPIRSGAVTTEDESVEDDNEEVESPEDEANSCDETPYLFCKSAGAVVDGIWEHISFGEHLMQLLKACVGGVRGDNINMMARGMTGVLAIMLCHKNTAV